MRRFIKNLSLLAFIIPAFFWLNCSSDNNPLAPNELAGTWNLVSMTVKDIKLTFNAGQPTDVGEGVLFTITGTLVLTDTRFTFNFNLTTQNPGQQPQTQNEIQSGTYSISGDMLSGVEDGGETFNVAINRSGNRLTIDDDEEGNIMIFEKQ